MRPNKELKLTKPSQDGASQLNSVFDGRAEAVAGTVMGHRTKTGVRYSTDGCRIGR